MTNFQEFLHKKAEEQRVISRRDLRDDWIDAVGRLVGQIREWLHEADPDGVLDRIDFPYDKAEKGLGRYKVDGLQINVGDLSVQVVPVARNVIGSPRLAGEGAKLAGRVNITNGIKTYILRRVLSDSGESWEVADDHLGAELLTRAKLESILQDLLA